MKNDSTENWRWKATGISKLLRDSSLLGGLRWTPWRRWVVRWSVSKPRVVADAARGSAGGMASRMCCWECVCPWEFPTTYTCSPWCDAAGTHCLHKHRKLKGSCSSAQIYRVCGNFLVPVVPGPFIKTSVKKQKNKKNLLNWATNAGGLASLQHK